MFHFQGEVEASKSLFIRALLVQSFFPSLKIKGSASCDDVRTMKKAIVALIRHHEIPCEEAGTVNRFMSLRASREKGTYRLTGSKRLLSRPLGEIHFVLKQLGVESDVSDSGIVIQSDGWKKPDSVIQVRRDHSSQFASGLLLSAWNLPFPLEFHMSGSSQSEGYFQMSVQFAVALGMNIEKKKDSWFVPAGQQVDLPEIEIEPDYSSMFTLAAAAALTGKSEFTNVGAQSLQPDFIFFKHLKSMGAFIHGTAPRVRVEKAKIILPIKTSLSDCPDLFPVLAVLCGFSNGSSELIEAPQLLHKESNRLAKTQELLKRAGVEAVMTEHGMRIQGHGMSFEPKPFEFDPDRDHRMAMAAGLLKLFQPEIVIKHPEVVNKSFPGFWRALGLQN